MPFTRRHWLQSAAAGIVAAPVMGGADTRKAPIKIGQIGVGHAHATKLSVYRASDDYEVVGIVEPDDQLWAQAQTQPAFAGLQRLQRDDLLSVPGLQAVLIETRVRDLLGNAKVCVDAGLHVHIDKPAGESLADLQAILDTATRKQLLVQMGYMYRYNPGIVLLREFLKNGWLGELFELHTVMSKVVGKADRTALAEYPGGSMFELGCHIIDWWLRSWGFRSVSTHFPVIRRARTTPCSTICWLSSSIRKPQPQSAPAWSRSMAERARHLTLCGTGGTFHLQPLDQPAAKITLAKPCGPYKAGTTEVALPKYVPVCGRCPRHGQGHSRGEIERLPARARSGCPAIRAAGLRTEN